MNHKYLFLCFFFILFLPYSARSQSWQCQNPLPTGNHLSSVKFIDSTTGWTVGDYGTIVHTTNGGMNWTSQSSGTSNILYSVSFTDANTGWAVGWHSIILHTTNGGSNWTTQTSGLGILNDLFGVTFINANTGWAVGSDGNIIHTTNGGTTWVSQATGTPITLVGVSFADMNNGWAVGGSGTVLHYVGTTWISEQPTTLLPKSILLHSNYPNSFNASTTLSYSLPRSERIELSVFNEVGDRVAVVASGTFRTGTYYYHFDGQGLSSGSYFVCLSSNGQTITRKIQLLK